MNALRSLFGRKTQVVAPDKPIYAIGDIHGRLDLLLNILKQIREHAGSSEYELIFLGDYIDRGPHSAGVIHFLSCAPWRDRTKATFLKGNHEASLLDFMREPSLGPAWLEFGGGETLLSYGVRWPALKSDREAWAETSRQLAAKLPRDHLKFLQRLELHAIRSGYMFVHAGIDPERSIDEQGEAEFLWIRKPFLHSRRRHEFVVVHGHSPDDRPYKDFRRIGVDTGAYQTGILTAVVISREGVEFISTS